MVYSDRMGQGVRKAEKRDVDGLTRSLARAFDEDPLINWIVRQDARRADGFDALFRVSLERLCLAHRWVLTTDDRTAGALWYPPGTSKISFVQQLRMLPQMILGASLRGLPRLIRVMDVLDEHHPKTSHFYLQFVGVDPDHRGRGLGTALMKPVLEHCDGEGLGAYLENSNERNLPLYRRLGFEVTEELELGRGAPPVWLMWREPQ